MDSRLTSMITKGQYHDLVTTMMFETQNIINELILSAAQNRTIGDWELFSILEHIPFSESFDLIMEKWNDDNSEIDSCEMLVSCLRGIGDPRGIEVLQKIYNNEDHAGCLNKA